MGVATLLLPGGVDKAAGGFDRRVQAMADTCPNPLTRQPDYCPACPSLCMHSPEARFKQTQDDILSVFAGLKRYAPMGKAANVSSCDIVIALEELGGLVCGHALVGVRDRQYWALADAVDTSAQEPAQQLFLKYEVVDASASVDRSPVGLVLMPQRLEMAEPYRKHRHPFANLLPPIRSDTGEALAATMALAATRWNITIAHHDLAWNGHGGTDTIVVTGLGDNYCIPIPHEPVAVAAAKPAGPGGLPDLLARAAAADGVPPCAKKRAAPVKKDTLALDLELVMRMHGASETDLAAELLKAAEDYLLLFYYFIIIYYYYHFYVFIIYYYFYYVFIVILLYYYYLLLLSFLCFLLYTQQHKHTEDDDASDLIEVPDVPPHCPTPPPPRPCIPVPPRACDDTFIWGVWQIAKVRAHGVHIGWGAVCGMHPDTNAARIAAGEPLECKKQITMGATMTSVQCRHHIKYWIKRGYDPGLRCRDDHIDLDIRVIPGFVESEDVLDAWAKAIADEVVEDAD